MLRTMYEQWPFRSVDDDRASMLSSNKFCEFGVCKTLSNQSLVFMEIPLSSLERRPKEGRCVAHVSSPNSQNLMER